MAEKLRSMIDWTPERIAALPIDGVKVLRENALRREQTSIADLCSAELAKRSPAQTKSHVRTATESRQGKYVIGFHFVCDREKGVKTNPDGTIWTGTWVVDQIHAERAPTVGAYVALHAAKSEPSYLQGLVRDWRKAEREREYAEGRPVQIQFGIDFLLQPTSPPYVWKGDGSGEKGYVWSTGGETPEIKLVHP